MPEDRIAILLNPSAGRGRALRHRARLERCLEDQNVPYDLIVTASEEDLRKKTRTLIRERETIAGAGGENASGGEKA